jgi:hypothetical protein
MKKNKFVMLAGVALAAFALQGQAAIVNLGSAGNFSVLGGSTVINTGPSVMNGGDVGLFPGSAIVGFPPGIVGAPFTTRAADAVSNQAQTDLTAAYNAAAGLPNTANLNAELGGQTLVPGVYTLPAATLTGTLTLNYQGNPNASFVFRTASSLTTASGSAVASINDPGIGGCNVFWQVGSFATLGAGSAFEGHIMANTSITLGTGASIIGGSALARTGAVNLDNNTITNSCGGTVPEPASIGILALGLASLGLRGKRATPASL